MLIVCPSCSTSYMIEPASLGPAGRTVRCARCRGTWFAETQELLNVFVDGVIAEAEEAERGAAPPPPDPTGFAIAEPAAPDFAPAADDPAPVHIADSPPLVPPLGEPMAAAIDHAPAAEHAPAIDDAPLPDAAPTPAPDDADNFAARRQRLQNKRQTARRSSRWTAIVLVLLAFNVALIGARNEVVRYLPQTASLFAALGLPVNLRQLAFEDVRVSRDEKGGSPMLSIEGKIVSKAPRTVEVPRLRFAARNAKGHEVYTWTARPERDTLRPGESLAFRSFAKPPEDAVDILVRFFNVQDATGGN